MKKILFIVLSAFIFLIQIFPHTQGNHQIITKNAYNFLEKTLGKRITEMYNHLDAGEIHSAWKNGTILAGAWREDEEDVVYGYCGVTPFGDGWVKSITHFWNADYGDLEKNHFPGTIGGDVALGGVYYNLGPYENSYQKMMKFRNGGWTLQFMFDNVTQCPNVGFGQPISYPIVGISFEYDNLIDFFLTGKAYTVGCCVNIDAGWRTSNVRNTVYFLKEFREQISWEILGRMCHLLQDLTVPAHVRCDAHGDSDPGIRQDSYESYVNLTPYTSDYIYNQTDTFIDPYNCPANPLHYLMYINAQISDHFGSNGPYNGVGNNTIGGNILPEEQQYLNSVNLISLGGNTVMGTPSNEQMLYQSSILGPQAIRSTAGLLYWFAKEAGLLTGSPYTYYVTNNYDLPLINVNGLPKTQTPVTVDATFGDVLSFEAVPQSKNNSDFVWNDYLPNSRSEWSKTVGIETRSIPNSNGRILNKTAISDNNATFTANLRKNCRITCNSITEFDGTITSTLSPIVENNNLIIPSTKPGISVGGTYNLAGIFSISNGSISTDMVSITPTDNCTISPLYKMKQKSNNSTTLNNNSQRKIARTTEGNLHFVYESMGRIWYELSTDGGTTWQIKNSGKPLDSGEGKNPSIDCYQDAVNIVWQEKSQLMSFIKFAAFNSAGEFWVSGVLNDFNSLFSFPPYSVDAKPVIASIGQTKFLVVWENKTQYFPGLVYYYGWITSNGNYIYNVTKLQSGSVPSTSTTSINPSIAVNKGFPSGVKHFCLAWEDFNQIRFLKYAMSFNDGSLTQVYAPFTISSGSSYAINKKPSVFAVSDTSARIVWNGVYDDGADYFSVAVFKASDNNQFSNFGDNVNSTNINGSSDITLGSQSAYAVAWAKNNNVIEYTPSSSLNTISTLSNPTNFSGKYIQISNGANPVDFRAITLNTPSNPPNYFQTKQIFNSNQMSKENASSISSGRGGCVYTDDYQFYFSIGDVSVNGNAVKFVDLADSVSVKSANTLNKYLVTEPFEINDNAKFEYSALFGVIDSAAAFKALKTGDAVKYKVELIDDKTGSVISSFDNLTFSKDKITKRGYKTYLVNAKGLGNKSVRLRLVTESNINADYAINNIYATGSVLKKSAVEELEIKNAPVVKEYALEQNYPNPFNPSTVINYQLPNANKVSLKVYDVLGKEIITLVDGFKEAGRYQVTFDCGKLASGVYIYKLESGNFVQSRKMILTK